MSDGTFNKDGIDATLATIIADGKALKEMIAGRFTAQDNVLYDLKRDATEIRAQTTKTNGRVSELERLNAAAAATAAAAAARRAKRQKYIFAIALAVLTGGCEELGRRLFFGQDDTNPPPAAQVQHDIRK